LLAPTVNTSVSERVRSLDPVSNGRAR